MTRFRFTPTFVALLLPFVLLCTGCSLPASPAHSDTASELPPAFSGPHSELFREVWTKEHDPKIHAIIGDEDISELEWNEVQQDFTHCITENGMTVREITAGGGFTVSYLKTPQDVGDSAIQSCKQESGLTAVAILHTAQFVNPNNEDFAVLMSACLVRAQVVQPEYSAADFRRESAAPPTGPGYDLSYAVPKSVGDDAANACNEDPTHAFQQ